MCKASIDTVSALGGAINYPLESSLVYTNSSKTYDVVSYDSSYQINYTVTNNQSGWNFEYKLYLYNEDTSDEIVIFEGEYFNPTKTGTMNYIEGYKIMFTIKCTAYSASTYSGSITNVIQYNIKKCETGQIPYDLGGLGKLGRYTTFGRHIDGTRINHD